MYLSRFDINPARRGAQKLLGSPQAMHAAVLAGFPPVDVPGERRSRVLWRVDTGPVHTRLYVTSDVRPDLTHLVEQAGWPTTHTWDTRPYGDLLDSLQVGGVWGFRLTANPTRSIKKVEGGRGQRVGHVTAAQQLAWLVDRSPRLGFSVTPDGTDPSVRVSARQTRQFRRQADKVTLVVAQYDGILTVTDVELLRTALVGGIGPAKAYGCGLLTLAPVAPQPAVS